MERVDIFSTPIESLKTLGMPKASVLKSEFSLFTFSDLLNFFPYRYIDKTKFYTTLESQSLETDVQIRGKIYNLQEHFKGGRLNRLTACLQDDYGNIELVWFRGFSWIKKQIEIGKEYVVFGRPTRFNNNVNISHPEIELLEKYQKANHPAILPVYPSGEKLIKGGVSNKIISLAIKEVLVQTQNKIQETLPSDILMSNKFIGRADSILNIHFPENQHILSRAKLRLKFEELFFLQLSMLRKKLIRTTKLSGYVFDRVGEKFNLFYQNNLKFALTEAQKRCVKEIRKDFLSSCQMNRLLQGDVGSGKTIVAIMTMLIAIDSGYQCCMMAPTEILANQHLSSLEELLKGLNVRYELLTGAIKGKKREDILNRLQNGEIDILIGTHALIEPNVKFKNLGYAIIDEQHRFGVEQRSKLWGKSEKAPHVLVMTATPIPRTLAMSFYGDLDVSLIDELPPGRKPIQTLHRYDSSRIYLYNFIKEEISKARQIYIVYPLIEESEKLDYLNLKAGYQMLTEIFPNPPFSIGMVHGKMKSSEKDEVIQDFLNKKIHILVATTVIEVGVNVPNASVMIIESAERFGLSQLHQLRGRVGRGAEQSYCILITGEKLSHDTRMRIETMCRTNDGFEISEVDLKLRGYGDLMGIKQSGDVSLKIADLTKDSQILIIARQTAQNILKQDPNLELEKNKFLKNIYDMMLKGGSIWAYVS